MNLDSKSLSEELRHAISRFQQPEFLAQRYFFFLVAGFFTLGAGFDGFAGFAAAFAGTVGAATGFGASAAPALSIFANFLSLPLTSFGFGCSLMPESLRRIFSRSSGVFPRPVNCIANT